MNINPKIRKFAKDAIVFIGKLTLDAVIHVVVFFALFSLMMYVLIRVTG